jgi:hypothetical protein
MHCFREVHFIIPLFYFYLTAPPIAYIAFCRMIAWLVKNESEAMGLQETYNTSIYLNWWGNSRSTSEYPVFGPRFEPETCRILRSAIHTRPKLSIHFIVYQSARHTTKYEQWGTSYQILRYYAHYNTCIIWALRHLSVRASLVVSIHSIP